MGARDFKDLVVWQLSMELFQLVIAITDREPARSDRDYCHQVRKAARSVSSNLAEGFGNYRLGVQSIHRYPPASLKWTACCRKAAELRDLRRTQGR
jgi:hypothetical protein